MENFYQENSAFILMVIGILFMLAFAMAFIIFVNASQKKILKGQMANQQLAYAHQEELLHSTILTQEAERKRIARDLHDEIGSKLNIIFLNIHRLKKPDQAPSEIVQITEEVESVINATIDTTRRISHDLLPPTLADFGLIEAIKELQHQFNQQDNFHVDFQKVNPVGNIDSKIIELNIYRVLQELINNSIKHGKATAVDIKLWSEADALHLDYQDNGKGFAMGSPEHKKGLGIKNIESRLHMLQATYDYETSLGRGFKMTITLDLE